MILAILCGLLGLCLGALGTWGYWIHRASRYKYRIQAFSKKAEGLSSNYDYYRRKYIDLDDAYRQLKKEEAIQRVAAHEWRIKYEQLQRSQTRANNYIDLLTINRRNNLAR